MMKQPNAKRKRAGRPKKSLNKLMSTTHPVFAAQQGLHGANRKKWRPLLKVCAELEAQARREGKIAPRKRDSNAATRPGEALRKAVKRQQKLMNELLRFMDEEMKAAGLPKPSSNSMAPAYSSAYALALGRATLRWLEKNEYPYEIVEKNGKKTLIF
jgi:hypothetical protein